jgi:hypothetical protein
MIKTNDSLGETPENSSGLGKFLGIGLVIWALWSFLSEKHQNKISIAGIKKRRSKRLFYMLDTGKGLTAVARQDVDNIKARNPNRLHAVWALNADDARALIKAGQGERYTGSTKKLDFAGHLLNCIGWQQVVDKNGKQITRCFIMAPNCKTKACVKETEERKAEGWKPKGRKQLQELTNLEGKKAPPECKNWGLEKFGLICEKIGDEFHFKTDSGTIKWKIKDVNGTFRLYHRSKYGHAGFHAQKERAWSNQKGLYSLTQYIIKHEIYEKGDLTPLQGVNLSCKQYVRDAYNKLRCKKYALTCASENECATQKAPIQWKQADIVYTPKAIRSVAKMLAEEMNQSIDDTKRVMRRIKYHGGIAPYAGGYLQEEYRDIPTKYKSKEGVKLDELAQEMEMDESALVEAINKAEEARSRLPRKKSRFSVKDMMFDAESYLAKQEGLSGLSFTKRDAAEAMTHEYAAFMRKLQDTALDLIDKSPADRAKIEKFKGDVKIISATNAPTYKQAREMIYPNLDYIFYEIIDELAPNFRTAENLRNIQSEIIYRQERYIPPETHHKTMPNEPIAKKPQHKIAEKGGQMTLFGIKDISQENLEKFRKFMSKYNDKTQFLDDYMAYSGGVKVKKAIEFYELEIERAKRNAPLDPEERKAYTRIINDLSALVEAMPPEFDDLTFNVVWNLAKSKENPIQMTLFGKLLAKRIAMQARG